MTLSFLRKSFVSRIQKATNLNNFYESAHVQPGNATTLIDQCSGKGDKPLEKSIALFFDLCDVANQGGAVLRFKLFFLHSQNAGGRLLLSDPLGHLERFRAGIFKLLRTLAWAGHLPSTLCSDKLKFQVVNFVAERIDKSGITPVSRFGIDTALRQFIHIISELASA
jgi:hypothetical protein